MSVRRLNWLLLAIFAVALGHLAWHVERPWARAEHVVGGHVVALSGTDPGAKQLYLRRTLHLAQRPEHAWLRISGRDRLRRRARTQTKDQAENV